MFGLSIITIAVPLVISALIILFYTWFKAFIARALGAKRGKKRWVLLSLVLAALIQVILLVVMKFLFYTEVGTDGLNAESITESGGVALIGAVLSFLLGVFVFSQCVKLGYLKSLLATVATFVPIMILVAGIGIVGALAMGKQGGVGLGDMMAMASMSSEGVSEEQLILAAEEVCACGDDQEMLMEKMMMFGMQSAAYQNGNPDDAALLKVKALNEKVTACVEGDQVLIAAREEDEANISKQSVETQIDQVDQDSEAEEDARPHYRKFSLSEAKKYIGTRVRVQRKAADPMVGTLVAFSEGSLKIQQRKYGGNVTFPISSKDVQMLEVYY